MHSCRRGVRPVFFFSSRRRHTRFKCDWSSDVCSSDLALTMIAAIALLSSLLANVPVAAASILMIKGYLVAAEVVPEVAFSPHFTQWPPASIPVFVGMMFGATLGGNATLIGASANIVAAGICARHGKPVTFATFLRYGLPVTAAQLAVSALYVLALLRILRSQRCAGSLASVSGPY